MIERVAPRRGAYYDSVTLMRVSHEVHGQDGVEAAIVAMATELNRELIERQGFDLSGDAGLTANDLVIAVRAVDERVADLALEKADAQLVAATPALRPGVSSGPVPRSLRSAVRLRPELKLALISVPGPNAPYEIASALEAGLHVVCFSSGISVEHETALKRRADELGLLMMGPDCGTAIVDGVGLGFANAVERGPVGIVGASGTGIQQIACLLDLAGVGVSHAIGVGGRDLGVRQGGRMMRRGLELLASDPGTEAIVLVSKQPDPDVVTNVTKLAGTVAQPVVLVFLGLNREPLASAPGLEHVDSLESAASAAAALAGASVPTLEEPAALKVTPGAIVGIFSGGSLCEEAIAFVASTGALDVSRPDSGPESRLEDAARALTHRFVDFGDESLTEGSPHPMIDMTPRIDCLKREVGASDVGVILIDVVLGYGAHPDPASELGPAIEEARRARDDVSVVVSLCGARRDPQGVEAQASRLQGAGAIVTRSNAQAARMAIRAAGLGQVVHAQ